jgi:cytochrome oxidase assembly protein ShyY1
MPPTQHLTLLIIWLALLAAMALFAADQLNKRHAKNHLIAQLEQHQ